MMSAPLRCLRLRSAQPPCWQRHRIHRLSHSICDLQGASSDDIEAVLTAASHVAAMLPSVAVPFVCLTRALARDTHPDTAPSPLASAAGAAAINERFHNLLHRCGEGVCSVSGCRLPLSTACVDVAGASALASNLQSLSLDRCSFEKRRAAGQLHSADAIAAVRKPHAQRSSYDHTFHLQVTCSRSHGLVRLLSPTRQRPSRRHIDL